MRAFRRDDDVAGQRQFEPAGKAAALHRDDHRLRQLGKAGDDRRLIMRPRRFDPAFLEVVPGAEDRPVRAQHDHADRIARGREIRNMRVEFGP